MKQRAAAKPLLQESREANGAYFIKPPVKAFKSSGITIDQIIQAFAHVLQIAIVDETGLKGKYDIDFTFSNSSPGSIMEDFASQAGLDVKYEERLADVFVVRPREKR